MSNTSTLDVSVKVTNDDDYWYQVDILSTDPDSPSFTLSCIFELTEDRISFASVGEMEAVAQAMLRAVAASRT